MAKRTVESCLIVGPPLGALRALTGTWEWVELGWVVNYAIDTTYSELRLSFNHGMRVDQEVPLCSTTPSCGGFRWWFLCPKCRRRVSHLYRPPDAYCFLCRHCHDLSYESAQKSGTWLQKYFRSVANQRQTTTRQAKHWVRRQGGYVPEVKRPL